MRDYKSLSHTRWDFKYLIVFIPKKRRKMIFGSIRKHLGEVFHDLARQKGVIIEEGHLIPDHVHMCLSMPPKYSVSNVVCYLKGKSAISIASTFKGKQKSFSEEAFCAKGLFCINSRA
jgi:putative transposase